MIYDPNRIPLDDGTASREEWRRERAEVAAWSADAREWRRYQRKSSIAWQTGKRALWCVLAVVAAMVGVMMVVS